MATSIPAETIFSTREAAEYLDFAEDTVRKYIQRGLISADKIGPVYVVRKSECDRYLREKRAVGERSE